VPHSVCPWWIGYLLLSPMRRWRQNPRRILEPWVRPGMTVVDVGCAMGYFTLPLAGLVGPTGRVVAVDLQARMVRALERRARRAGLSTIIETRICTADSLGLADLAGCVDFALAFAVAHEVPDVRRLMDELAALLPPAGRVLLAEPSGHVSAEEFAASIAAAEAASLTVESQPAIARSRAVVLAAGGGPRHP
jgi:2-polyprenyl-3-methyl-5-hydroxy-6-metoxy-1,4-benzoquinol methylase